MVTAAAYLGRIPPGGVSSDYVALDLNYCKLPPRLGKGSRGTADRYDSRFRRVRYARGRGWVRAGRFFVTFVVAIPPNDLADNVVVQR